MEILVVICFNKLSLKRQQFWMEWILFFSCLTVVRYTEMILKEDLLHSQIHDIKIQTDNTEHYRFPSFRKWKRMNKVCRTHHPLIISSRSNAFVWMLVPLAPFHMDTEPILQWMFNVKARLDVENDKCVHVKDACYHGYFWHEQMENLISFSLRVSTKIDRNSQFYSNQKNFFKKV